MGYGVQANGKIGEACNACGSKWTSGFKHQLEEFKGLATDAEYFEGECLTDAETEGGKCCENSG